MASEQAKPAKVQLGIDVLAAGGFAQLAGLRIGLLANDASRDSSGRRTVDVLAKAPGVRLVALFSPEHGLGADRDGQDRVRARSRQPASPIHSLYGAQRRPSRENARRGSMPWWSTSRTSACASTPTPPPWPT